MCQFYSKLYVILIFLICDQSRIAGSVCPNGCNCGEKAILCNCGDNLWSQQKVNGKTKLRLDVFTGRIDFTNVLIVHSCDHLIVPNDTFVGVDIIEQLKFIGIGNLEIHPHAFRGIRTSPRQLVIQDSHVPVLRSHSFEGLKHLDHFWLRNVTVGRIAKMAFGRVSNVQYVYFRDVAIGSIEAGAFAHMTNISYFYLREKVLIKTMSDFIFIGSTIEEIVFENAHIHSTDLSLVGIHAERIHIIDSKWNARKVQTIRRVPAQKVSELFIQNSNINRLVLSLLYNYTNVILNGCKILHLQPAPGIILQNISLISFTQCSLTHWHPHALTVGREIGKIEWSYSSIENIHHHAIYSCDILKLHFHNVKLTTLASKAFEQNGIQEMSLIESSVKLFGKMFLSRSEVQNLTISRLEVGMIEEGAFASLNSSLLSISESKFDSFAPMFFQDSFIDELNIRNCSFNSYAPSDAFYGLHANKLLVQNCEFNCSVHACEENSLLLQPSMHSIAWRFEDNKCKLDQYTNAETEEAKICVQQELDTRSGITCRRLTIEECVCTDGSTEILYPLNTNATVLILGDCHHVRIFKSQNFNSSLQILYLYRIASLEIVSVDRSLSQLHILHSHVHFSKPYAFANLNLHEVSFSGTFVDNIAPLTFAWSNIDFFNVNASTLRLVAANAFANSQIQTVEFWQTNAISVGQLFEAAKEVRIESSFIHEVRGLENVTNLCLRNNSINCRCMISDRYTASFAGSICDDPFAQCIESSSEYNVQYVDCQNIWENFQLGSYYSSGHNMAFTTSVLFYLAFLLILT